MYEAADGPVFSRQADWQSEARIHPYLDYVLNRQQKNKFLPGMSGRVRDFDEQDFRQIRAIYYGMIAETDAQLGQLWSALRSAGAWDDTIIILTSDHAELMGDHFLLGKGGYFDGSYHIPLIIRDPCRSNSAGTRVTHFTEAVDIMPTLIDMLGEKLPAHLDGRSLVPFLDRRPPPDWRDAAHWEFDFRSVETGAAEAHFGIDSRQCNLAVIRTDRYKYIHFGGLPPLLFDLADDPGELCDLAARPEHLPLRLELAERLLVWRSKHLDQSLALSQLTEHGVTGHFAPLPPNAL
jgi:arylsulfatase A-like enzyme